MASSPSTVRFATDPSVLPPRWARALRSATLLAVGLAITFTATLHGDLAFDVAMASSGLALIGAVQLVEWAQRRGASGAPVALAIGIVSLIAAALVFMLRVELALAVVLAGWALVSALLEFIGMIVFPGSRQDAALLGGIGVLLALVLLLVREDLVAVIGFFGGYAIIAGVFLGIAAFDRRSSISPDQAESER